jgi:hypothetical protein
MLDVLIYAFVGWLIYRMIVSWLALKELEKNVDYAVELLAEKEKYKMLMFEQVEQNGHNVVLCYDINNNFVAQGATKEEVIDLARQRYPNQNLATHKIEELQWIKPKSEKNSTNG